jgi:hypothetical protein
MGPMSSDRQQKRTDTMSKFEHKSRYYVGPKMGYSKEIALKKLHLCRNNVPLRSNLIIIPQKFPTVKRSGWWFW